jgi:hypothetical protein
MLIGGEVPRLVAVEGDIVEDGRFVLIDSMPSKLKAHFGTQLSHLPSPSRLLSAPSAIFSNGISDSNPS